MIFKESSENQARIKIQSGLNDTLTAIWLDHASYKYDIEPAVSKKKHQSNEHRIPERNQKNKKRNQIAMDSDPMKDPPLIADGKTKWR